MSTAPNVGRPSSTLLGVVVAVGRRQVPEPEVREPRRRREQRRQRHPELGIVRALAGRSADWRRPPRSAAACAMSWGSATMIATSAPAPSGLIALRNSVAVPDDGADQPGNQDDDREDDRDDRALLVDQDRRAERGPEDDRRCEPRIAAEPDGGLDRHRQEDRADGDVDVVPVLPEQHRRRGRRRRQRRSRLAGSARAWPPGTSRSRAGQASRS